MTSFDLLSIGGLLSTAVVVLVLILLCTFRGCNSKG